MTMQPSNNKPILFLKANRQKTNNKHLTLTLIMCAFILSTNVAFAEVHQSINAQQVLAVSNQPLPNLRSLQHTAPLKLTLPKIEHLTTNNGVPVLFVASHSLPIVDVSIRFNAGSARDESIKKDGFGIANMVAAMLTQGTQTLDEEAFTKAVEALGIELSSQAYKDMFVVSLRSLSDQKQLIKASQLITQMLTEPKFNPLVLKRNQQRLLVALKQQQQDPSAIANLAFMQALYQDHPYAHQSMGTSESVPNITINDLQKFIKQYLVANNASIAITGDLTKQQAFNLANRLTSNLPVGNKAKQLPEPTPVTGKYIHIPFDSTQTTVMMGQLGDKRATTPKAMQQQMDFAVGNDVLAGNSFNAKLMQKVRKQLGYTYGIYGSMQPMQTNGYYAISFSTRDDKSRQAVDATLATINSTLAEGITSNELQLTKDHFKNSFATSFVSNAQINGLLGSMGFYSLPDSYLTNYLQRVDHSNLTKVNQSLQTTLDPKNFIIITVGNRPIKDTKAQVALSIDNKNDLN